MDIWDFRVLGAVEVRRAGEFVPITAAKHRIVLASLLLSANFVLSNEELYARLWGAEPPHEAKKTLQGYVARLRKRLEPEILETRHHGYLMSIKPEMLDIVRFESLLDQAERAKARPEQVAMLLRQALQMWRGLPLADVPSELLQRTEATSLAERRLQVLEWRISVDLTLNRQADIVPELYELVSKHPHRERLWSHLMVALYRSGRQADALDAYRRARMLFVDELGIEPGHDLQRLQQVILSGDAQPPDVPAATAHIGVVPRPAPVLTPATIPAELPPDIADFTGRREAVKMLEALLAAEHSVASHAAPIVTVTGPGGVGKTALAIHVAYRLRDQFRDGQLYAHLRAGEPVAVEPRDVLAHFLRALGVAVADIPDSIEDRSALYRSSVAGRSILVALDSAASEAQVRPLLPGSPRAATLITARVALAGIEGVQCLRLPRFDQEESIKLLTRIVDSERVRAEPAAADEIIAHCGRLPLALRIAGVRLAGRPHSRLSWLASRLDDGRRRLDELVAGDLNLRAVLSLDRVLVPPAARRALDVIGTFAEPVVDVAAVAAALGVSESDAYEQLDVLVEHHVLDVAETGSDGPVRYVIEHLQWLFAQESSSASG